MAKSILAERMDLVQTQITGLLQPLGFRKSARTYNRTVEPGLVHVVNVQMGHYDLVDPIPGFRENLYGRFTVNTGVYVSELDIDAPTAQRNNVPEYLCAIRARLGELLRRESDLWWPLNDDWPDVAGEVVQGLVTAGLPFLEQFSSRDNIVDRWIRIADDYRLSLVARVDVARILAARGDLAAATVHLQAQYANTQLPAHRDYLEKLAARLNIDLVG